jgi:hypothetical protein
VLEWPSTLTGFGKWRLSGRIAVTRRTQGEAPTQLANERRYFFFDLHVAAGHMPPGA